MLQRPARRTVQTWSHQKTGQTNLATKTPTKSIFRLMLGIGVFLISLSGISYFFFASSTINCVTNIFTTCTAAEEGALQNVYPNRWHLLTKSPEQTIPELQEKLPELESLKTYISWRGEAKAQITRSHLIATVQIGNEHWEILSGGQQRAGQPSIPNIQIADQTAWQTWLESYQAQSDALNSLEALFTGLQMLRPRATTVKILSKDEVEIRLENSSRALIHLHSPAEIQNQLHTLQALFSSSTMDTQPTEVDVRFKNVITR